MDLLEGSNGFVILLKQFFGVYDEFLNEYSAAERICLKLDLLKDRVRNIRSEFDNAAYDREISKGKVSSQISLDTTECSPLGVYVYNEDRMLNTLLLGRYLLRILKSVDDLIFDSINAGTPDNSAEANQRTKSERPLTQECITDEQLPIGILQTINNRLPAFKMQAIAPKWINSQGYQMRGIPPLQETLNDQPESYGEYLLRPVNTEFLALGIRETNNSNTERPQYLVLGILDNVSSRPPSPSSFTAVTEMHIDGLLNYYTFDMQRMKVERKRTERKKKLAKSREKFLQEEQERKRKKLEKEQKMSQEIE